MSSPAVHQSLTTSSVHRLSRFVARSHVPVPTPLPLIHATIEPVPELAGTLAIAPYFQELELVLEQLFLHANALIRWNTRIAPNPELSRVVAMQQ